ERLLWRNRIVRDLGDERDVLPRGEARHEVVELENEADVPAPIERELPLRRVREVLAAEQEPARRRAVEPAEDIEERRFAAARRALEHDELALGDREIDAPKRVHGARAAAVDLGQPLRLEAEVLVRGIGSQAAARRARTRPPPGLDRMGANVADPWRARAPPPWHEACKPDRDRMPTPESEETAMPSTATPIRYFALIYGIVFLVVGIAGFVPGLMTPLDPTDPMVTVNGSTGRLFGLFPVNSLHN